MDLGITAFFCVASLQVYNGLEESIKLIDTTVRHFGPFDGVIGFAQGATMAAIILALQVGLGRL